MHENISGFQIEHISSSRRYRIAAGSLSESQLMSQISLKV